MNSRDLLQAMEGIGEEIVLKTAPAEEDTERKDKRFRRLIPFAALLSLAACLAFVWLIVRKPVAAKAESPDWDSAPLTEKELELPTADLIDVILKKDCLWQSHLQSGSGIWGPYEEWLEKLNGMRELEKRADAGRILYRKMMEYYVMYTEMPAHLQRKDEASWYRLRAIQTMLQQEIFLSQLETALAESVMSLIRTAEEGDRAYIAGKVYTLKEFTLPRSWEFTAWYVFTSPMPEDLREKVLSQYTEADCERAIRVYGFEKAVQQGSKTEWYIIPFAQNGHLVSYVEVTRWNNGGITVMERRREPDMILFDMWEALSFLSSPQTPMRLVADHNGQMFFVVGKEAYVYTGIPKNFVGRPLSGLSAVQKSEEDTVICIQ